MFVLMTLLIHKRNSKPVLCSTPRAWSQKMSFQIWTRPLEASPRRRRDQQRRRLKLKRRQKLKLSPPKANPNNSSNTKVLITNQTWSKWFLCGRTTLSILGVRTISLIFLWLRLVASLTKSRLRRSWSRKSTEVGLKTELQIITIRNNTRTIITKIFLLATMSKTKWKRLNSKLNPKSSNKKNARRSNKKSNFY